jgi:hypothetical protein
MKRRQKRGLLAGASIALLLAASPFGSLGCGGSSASGGAGGGSKTTSATGSGGQANGSILFDISGEVLALGGYGFPPATADDPAFVDGWEIKFTELIVTVDKIKISEDPDTDPGNESKVGKLVGEVDGPFAVDLHKGGPIMGKGGADEQAVQLATRDNQNLNGGAGFETDKRYAFGFDVVPASAAAKMINLDAQGAADYALMQQSGYTVLYVGTATFKGTNCTPNDPEFAKLPPVVNFRLGFKSPTTYINCQNPDLDPATPLGMEEHERGIVTKANQQVIAQLTIHTDHPFWESFIHDSPAHFDMVAARAAGATGVPTVVLEDVVGVDPTAITDKQNNPVPWRTCTSFYTPPSSGQMSFDSQGIPVNPAGDPGTSIRDLYDYMTYNQSTQGHLNSDGLCYVSRNYPSPN